jgi:hypothetical protein
MHGPRGIVGMTFGVQVFSFFHFYRVVGVPVIIYSAAPAPGQRAEAPTPQ